MKIWTSEHIFNHPWERVTQAVWRKYPNPHKPEIVGTDVLEREVYNGVLYSTRIITSRWGLPEWARRIIGSDRICYAHEYSEVNPGERKMVMRTKNLTLASTVSMDERMEYFPDPSDSSRTILKQETLITVQGVPLTSYIENYLINSISSNSFKGREAMEWVISKIDKEVEELMSTYKRSTNELLTSIGGITYSAKKSIDEFSSAAIKGIDEIQHLTQPSTQMPRI